MGVFLHPHLTRGVVKTARGAFQITRGRIEMPDDIGESLGWRRVEEDETPAEPREPSAHRMSPAMAVNVSDKLWSMVDIVRMVDEWEAAQKAA